MKHTTLVSFTCLFLWALTANLYAQVTLRLTSIPAHTPADASIFFAGSIQGWNPGDNAWKLTKGSDGIFSITIPEGTGSVQYKFTLGTWDKVEKGPNGEEVPNRIFTFTGSPQTLALSVASWAGTPVSTATSNVQILSQQFDMPQLGRTRRIWLYLPPDYHSTTKRYPVIYMQDGQNLFDNTTAFAGEWQVDETLNRLHSEGDFGAIVVGIDNGGNQRIHEYAPWVNSQYGGGGGNAYLDFLVQTLKPHIDANYRTLTGPGHTCLFGSSLGALIATYGAVRHPTVFGKVGAFSPAYWFNYTELTQYIAAAPAAALGGLRLAHAAGQNESQNMVTHLENITTGLQAKGLTTGNTYTQTDADGTHSESYWRRAFAAAYQFLFAGSILPVQLGSLHYRPSGTCSGSLQWQTLFEQNNKGFLVEHSTDGNRFATIGFVAAKGNSTTPASYSFEVHPQPKTTNYYRLQQTDNDGKSSFSPVVKTDGCTRVMQALLYPNPATNRLFIASDMVKPGDEVTIYSMDGKAKGNWVLPGSPVLDTGHLHPGLYVLSINGIQAGRFIKQ